MRRILVQVGRSLAVRLPAEFVRRFGLVAGDAVDVDVEPGTGLITIAPAIQYFEGGRVTPRFRKMVAKTLKKRSKLFERLAKT